jgi:uncharacterized membrane protein
MTDNTDDDRSLIIAGGVIGFGFGGLVDVVIFHLILQIHHLISGIVPPTTPQGLRLNLLADGLFSLVMVLIMSGGFVLFWRTLPYADRSRATAVFTGAVVVGIGGFNFYDGTIDHYVLGLHHTVQWPPNPSVFDLIWLIGSIVLLVAGALTIRAEQ